MRLLSAAGMLSAFLFTANAQADFYDGNSLKKGLDYAANTGGLNTGELVEAAGALGYVTGVADAFHLIGHCLPSNVTKGQLGDVVLQYLNRHPEIRHQPSASLVTSALAEAFPCRW